MRYPVHISKRTAAVLTAIAGIIVAAGLLISARSHGQSAPATASQQPAANSSASSSEPALDLSSSQLSAIKIEPVRTYLFPVEEEAVGNISFADDLSVQVFPSYQGKIIQSLVELGEEVQKCQPLYTIDSPDLIQNESTLIGAAATLELTAKELDRARSLNGTNGVSQRELEQATSDQQTAEGALKAARDAVRLFGKTEAEIDAIAANRKIDPVLVVPSPITSRVTARNAQPGLLVQPGNAPAPYSVADLSTKWMVANVSESDSPLIHEGQPIKAELMAYPGRTFEGKVTRLGADVDPNTHRVMVRCEIADPKDELRPGMLANFSIRVQDSMDSVAIPANG